MVDVCLRILSLLDALVCLLDSSASLPWRWECWGSLPEGGRGAAAGAPLSPPSAALALGAAPELPVPRHGTLRALSFASVPATTSPAALLDIIYILYFQVIWKSSTSFH